MPFLASLSLSLSSHSMIFGQVCLNHSVAAGATPQHESNKINVIMLMKPGSGSDFITLCLQKTNCNDQILVTPQN